jgi:hypothetical protein
MAGTGGERITDTFQFKHHAISVPDITATDRIIDTTTRLTAAIAGIQDAPPDKMEVIQSLCTLLPGKIALLPPPTPSILPTPPPPTPLINEDKPIIIWNPQPVQPSLPTHNHNTNNIGSDHSTLAIVKDNCDDDSPIPSHSTRPPRQHLILPIAKPPSHMQSDEATHCQYDQSASLRKNSCPHLHFAFIHLHFIADVRSWLKASSWKQSLYPLTPPFTSSAPSLMMTQVMPSNIDT